MVQNGHVKSGSYPPKLLKMMEIMGVLEHEYWTIGESWGMANDGEWRTGQYLVEGVKVIKCFHPRMLTPSMTRVHSN